MNKIARIVLVSFLFVIISACYSLGMSMPQEAAPPQSKTSAAPSADTNTTAIIKSAGRAICDGNFTSAEQIIKQADINTPASRAILKIVSQNNQIQQSMQQAREKAFGQQLAELEKFKKQPETNEPNTLKVLPVIVRWAEEKWLCSEGNPDLLEIFPVIAGKTESEPNLIDIFPVILKIYEFADKSKKAEIMNEPFVKAVIARSLKAAADYESKGQWLNAMIYCYSWLNELYKDDKTYADKKEQLEEKVLIKASLTDSPCETSLERYEKVKPQMFIRALDVLEYGYVEPVHYRNMAEKAIKRCRSLAEVLSFNQESDKSFKIQIEKDKIPQFIGGLNSLETEFNAEPAGLSRDQFIKIFNHILALNSATMKMSEQILIWHFAEAGLDSLDPHTMLIWPKQVEDFEKNITNEFTGIGVEISQADGPLKAASLLPGTPAYSSGLDAGDTIEAINGESTKDMSITCAVSKITGPAGTKVTLTIKRQGEEKTKDIEITRAKIIVPTTRGWSRDDNGKWLYFVDDKDKIGYVRITNFSATTAQDIDTILTQLESAGLKAFILDLRFNTGGYLQSAADISDLFLEKGVIVSTQPRVGLPTWETARGKGTHPNYPLVILINSSSASASEIVAGAMADKAFSRATLVGQQSYGKGSVQTITGYPGEGAQLKYTMAYYHLPSGQRVNDRWAMERAGKKDWGVMPNVKIELNMDEMKKVLDIQRDNDVLAAADHDQNKTKLKRHSLKETLEADSQLTEAILVAKTKIIESGL